MTISSTTARQIITRERPRQIMTRGQSGSAGNSFVSLQNGDVVPLPHGTAVYISAFGVMQRAIANDPVKCRVSGFVAEASVAVGARGSVQVGGACALFSGLAAGTYYLDAVVAGHITQAAPGNGSGFYQAVLGEALSATTLDFKREPTFQV